MKQNFFHSLQLYFAKVFLSACVIIISSSSVKAQASLGFYNTIVSPNAVHYNDSIPVSTTLKNYSAFTFQGTVNIRYSVNGVTQTDTVPPFYLNNFPSNDSQYIFFVLNASPLLGFADGDNYVVIWPAALGTFTHDSVTLHIFVDTLAGIKESKISPVKINVRNEKIYFSYQSNNFDVANFSLVNMLGSTVFSVRESKPEFISIADLPVGIYLLHVKTKNQQLTFKVCKQ